MYFLVKTECGDNEIFFGFRASLLIFLCIINIYFFIVSFKFKITSRNGLTLIRCQSVVSFILIVIYFFDYFRENEKFSNENKIYSIFYCYIWYFSIFYWIFSTISVYIMALISFDRFICIVFPLYYKKLTVRFIFILLLIMSFCVSIVCVVSTILYVNIAKNNNTDLYFCTSKITISGAIINTCFHGLIPIISLAGFNAMSARNLARNSKTQLLRLDDIKRLKRTNLCYRFSISSFIMTILYLIGIIWCIILNILWMLQTINISNNCIVSIYYFVFIVLTAVNPFVHFILFRKARNYCLYTIACGKCEIF
uniref:GCR146 n=1 Tax=Schmidtea mediterranea TaxID=79327 RepID=A0A193KUE9_SCHMD|nr:GCR146 [Schmidtea mediterranea]